MNEQRTNLEKVTQMRDELKLQANLFKAETRDMWNVLEDKVDTYNLKMKVAMKTATKSSSQVGAAKDLLVEEIIQAYEEIKTSIKQ